MIKKYQGNTRETVNILKSKNESDKFEKFYCFGLDYLKDPLNIPIGSTCCFNHYVGLPRKNGKNYAIFPFQLQLIEQIEKNHKVAILKSRGIGCTEILLRYLLFKVLIEDWKDSQIILVTGARLELAVSLIKRMKKILNIKQNIKDTKNTTLELNGCTIEGFPAQHSDSMRGLSHVKAILWDECDFTMKSEVDNIQSIIDGYNVKGLEYTMLVSTPNLPNGLLDNMFKDPLSQYRKIPLNYKIGLDLIYSQDEIAKAKKSASFEREFNLAFGYGVGDIYPNELLKGIIEDYDLTLKDGQKILCVDPAFGSSKFAIIGMEQISNIIYVKECLQFTRASPSAMLDLVISKAREYGSYCLVDSAHSGLIRDINSQGVYAKAVNFRVELSNMTTESAQCIKEKRVRIHKAFTDLISQLRAVRYNDRGHPDKTELSFDLGDAFLMGCNHFRNSKVRIISVPMQKSHNSYSFEVSDYVCASCKMNNHSNNSHTMWIEDEEDIRTIQCLCDKC